jgi:formate/nitrite transporter FocA (FNT family)
MDATVVGRSFLATMGRTIIGKYIPVLITVMAFVAGGFLHSPANMAYLSLSQPLGQGPGWGDGLLWAVLPAAIGNIIGAFFLVALPFYIASSRGKPNRSDHSRGAHMRATPITALPFDCQRTRSS